MATVLDVGLLSKFSFIFSMLLIIVIVYGILEYTKIFGDRQGLHILIAFLVGVMLLIVPAVNEVISTITPWFILMFVFILLLIIAYKMLGATDADIKHAMATNSSIVYWVLIFGAIILLGSLGKVFFTGTEQVGPYVNESGVGVTGEVGTTGTGALWATIFHPKVLGLIFLLLIGVFTITSLTSKMSVS